MSDLPEETEALPEIADDEIRIRVDGGIVQLVTVGKDVDLSKLNITVVDYDTEGADLDKCYKDEDGSLAFFHGV